jgi:hypothetical protein
VVSSVKSWRVIAWTCAFAARRARRATARRRGRVAVLGDGALLKGVKGGFPAAVRWIIIVGEGCQSKMLNGKRCASNGLGRDLAPGERLAKRRRVGFPRPLADLVNALAQIGGRIELSGVVAMRPELPLGHFDGRDAVAMR